MNTRAKSRSILEIVNAIQTTGTKHTAPDVQRVGVPMLNEPQLLSARGLTPLSKRFSSISKRKKIFRSEARTYDTPLAPSPDGQRIGLSPIKV